MQEHPVKERRVSMTEFKQAPVVGSKRVDAGAAGTKAKVYFTRTIDAEHLIKL